jgi:3-hydroxyisobutyrate dehydrogenase-like beta-hydroxyacid dehydrogenase
MCANLARKSGRPVIGADLKPEPLTRLAGLGVGARADAVALARDADIVFLSLPGGPEVEAVCGAILAAPGRAKTIVDMSTTPAALSRKLAARFKEKGVDFADAPVARLRQAAKDGTLSIMVGAEPAVFERVKPYLLTMGTDVTHCGAVGAGEVVKVLNNMLVFLQVQAIAEALAIGRASGVDGKVLLETLAISSADSFALRNQGLKYLLPGHFPTETFPTDYAIEGGIDATAARNTMAMLKRVKAHGWSAEYYPIMLKLIDGSADRA